MGDPGLLQRFSPNVTNLICRLAKRFQGWHELPLTQWSAHARSAMDCLDSILDPLSWGGDLPGEEPLHVLVIHVVAGVPCA